MNTIPDSCDPLTRVIDAFVEQSVPEGPEDAVKRRLVAALAQAESPAVLAWMPPARTWRPVRALATAATVAAIAAGSYLFGVRQGEQAAESRRPAVAVVEPAPQIDSALTDVFTPLMQEYLQLDPARRADRARILLNLVAAAHANPRLQAWRVAQERLGDVLDRPEMVGLGMGVISTLPLSHFARF